MVWGGESSALFRSFFPFFSKTFFLTSSLSVVYFVFFFFCTFFRIVTGLYLSDGFQQSRVFSRRRFVLLIITSTKNKNRRCSVLLARSKEANSVWRLFNTILWVFRCHTLYRRVLQPIFFSLIKIGANRSGACFVHANAVLIGDCSNRWSVSVFF